MIKTSKTEYEKVAFEIGKQAGERALSVDPIDHTVSSVFPLLNKGMGLLGICS